ncbi:MAG TPA: hypothetical protein VFI60_04580 [Candidatus Acidoferrum sp.]|nr:hypothetical protein [Candidatus Acidoferrum sp.]
MSSSPNESSIAPHGESTFEHVAHRLHLSPSEYATSTELKEWARGHKDHKYVPSQLLELWGFEVDDELFGKTAKPPKRAA